MRRTFLLVFAVSMLTGFCTAQESRPIAAGGAAPAVTVPTFQNEICPVMGKPVNTKFFVDGPHGRVYVCCKMCVKKVEADPEGMYKKAYPTTKKAANKICPVTGEALDAKPDFVTVQGVEIGTCCTDCVKPVVDNAQIYLARFANPKLKDLGNETDPITGAKVANNTFCVIGDELVHLASSDSIEAVRKDPKKALEKAKEGKAPASRETEKKGGPHEGGCCAGKGADDGGCCSGGAASKPAKPAN
jgi:hypothetical protein